MVMPGGMTGNELASAAAKLRPNLKVLYTSGFASAAVRDNTLLIGSLLITKPYRRADLSAKLREALDS